MTDANILDTSMALEWLLPVGHDDDAARTIERPRERPDCVPALWRSEMMNAVTRMHRQGAIAKAELPRLLTDVLVAELPLANLDSSLVRAAGEVGVAVA